MHGKFIPLRLHGAAMTQWMLPCLIGGTPPAEEFIAAVQISLLRLKRALKIPVSMSCGRASLGGQFSLMSIASEGRPSERHRAGDFQSPHKGQKSEQRDLDSNNKFLCLGRSAVPCFALHSNAEAITFQMVRPQDVCFPAGYVFVPGQSLLQEV